MAIEDTDKGDTWLDACETLRRLAGVLKARRADVALAELHLKQVEEARRLAHFDYEAARSDLDKMADSMSRIPVEAPNAES